MNHLDHLIRLRIYEVLEEVSDYLEGYLETSPYLDVDVEFWVALSRFFYDFDLGDKGSFVLSEEYTFSRYTLSVTHYHYAYINADGKSQVSYDNSPHHPDLSTFPHHKHYYPKRRNEPAGFSGELSDALREIRWLLQFTDAIGHM